MSEVTDDDVRSAFEDDHEVLNVERNRSQFRVFLDPEDVTQEDVEATLADAFGEDSVFGVGVTDEMWGDDDVQVRVASFRIR